MPDTTVALDDLTQQIAQHESDLNRLRQEFEVRQTRLTDLARHREELQAQLRQVEADIQAVTQGQTPRPAATTVTSSDAKPATAISPKLADALVEVAREANRPLTARELGEQLVLRKFPTTSNNITNLVQNRLTELVKRGVFRRAEGQPGVVLAKPGDEKKSPAPKAHSNGKAAPAKKIARTRPAKGPAIAPVVADRVAPEELASRFLHATWPSRCLRRATRLRARTSPMWSGRHWPR